MHRRSSNAEKKAPQFGSGSETIGKWCCLHDNVVLDPIKTLREKWNSTYFTRLAWSKSNQNVFTRMMLTTLTENPCQRSCYRRDGVSIDQRPPVAEAEAAGALAPVDASL